MDLGYSYKDRNTPDGLHEENPLQILYSLAGDPNSHTSIRCEFTYGQLGVVTSRVTEFEYFEKSSIRRRIDPPT
jgi:hypothetical protein